jgi:hypothetical protein
MPDEIVRLPDELVFLEAADPDEGRIAVCDETVEGRSRDECFAIIEGKFAIGDWTVDAHLGEVMWAEGVIATYPAMDIDCLAGNFRVNPVF